MSKYDPLSRHLSRLTTNRWTASFAEIEKILGFALPASAKKYNAWWANQGDGGHAQSGSWQGVGWKTSEPDFRAKTVKFVRGERAPYFASPPEPMAQTQEKRPEPSAQASESVQGMPSNRMLTIDEAKAGLAAFYGIPQSKIEITIRG